MKKLSVPAFAFLLLGSALFGGTQKTITIENTLDVPVYYLYLSPVDVKEWGEDRLGDETLEPGATIDIEMTVEDSLYDLMAEDESEKAYKIMDLNLMEISRIVISEDNFFPFGGLNPVYRNLSFTNSTGEDIYYLYISSAESMYWGEDLLGDDILYNGDTITLEIPIDEEYPVNDLLAEGESGSSYEIPGQNMLETEEYTFTEMDKTSSGDYEDYDDYDYEDYDDYSSDSDEYLRGYRDGYRDAWKEAYSLGYQDAMNQ